ncbi:MAG: phage major capsid protein [Rhodobacteraceae bacterium]|nr:phage major capsid protein [Paracoccaceae bacterium]
MLDSLKIQRRQSEIRQALAELAGAEALTDETRAKMDAMDTEYQDNERKFRAALIGEDEQRQAAKGELETREGRQWADLVAGFELRQAVFALDEGRALSGRTAEVVEEMRASGGYRGIPVPLGALLETRAGETIASGTPNPMQTMPIVDRLFASTVAAQMGVATINIAQGEREYPVVSSSIAAGWADGELANVAGPTAFATTDKALAPDSNFGVQLRMTRKALKQSGAGLEAAMRRDMLNAMQVGLDAAVFQGTGATGQPLGILPGAATYGITSTAIDAAPDFDVMVDALARFLVANAGAPGSVNAMIRPEVWAKLMKTTDADGNYMRLIAMIQQEAGRVVVTSNGLAAPTGDPLASSALMTTAAGGLPPAFLAIWGGVDLIRDVYADAQSGGVRLTGVVSADVTVARGAQLEILTGLQA